MKKSFYVDGPARGFGGFKRDFPEADFVLFGVPFDSTSSFRPGSRFGPSALRETSANLETWSWRTGVDFEEVKLHDMGDLAVVHGDSAETIRRVAETVEDIFSSKKVPIIVGGEHMMTLGAVKAFKEITVVSFDAHFDMRDEYLSNKLSHACVMRRTFEELGAGKVFLMGVRATYRDEMDFVKKSKIDYLTSLEMMRSGTKTASSWLHDKLRYAKRLYISIDIDVLDPAYAPGVGNPEPEGISPTVLLDILNEVADDKVVGFDLMEYTPQYDNGSTAAIASKIIFEICSMIMASRR
jgi:agmatinase